ncbi:unnamed protein product [Amoebophrya sp. A25]|nr:unnamed protein product [Amoebophrya sp. A25]|eukprot:GSA25T00005747001.1
MGGTWSGCAEPSDRCATEVCGRRADPPFDRVFDETLSSSSDPVFRNREFGSTNEPQSIAGPQNLGVHTSALSQDDVKYMSALQQYRTTFDQTSFPMILQQHYPPVPPSRMVSSTGSPGDEDAPASAATGGAPGGALAWSPPQFRAASIAGGGGAPSLMSSTSGGFRNVSTAFSPFSPVGPHAWPVRSDRLGGSVASMLASQEDASVFFAARGGAEGDIYENLLGSVSAPVPRPPVAASAIQPPAPVAAEGNGGPGDKRGMVRAPGATASSTRRHLQGSHNSNQVTRNTFPVGGTSAKARRASPQVSPRDFAVPEITPRIPRSSLRQKTGSTSRRTSGGMRVHAPAEQ